VGASRNARWNYVGYIVSLRVSVIVHSVTKEWNKRYKREYTKTI